MNLAPGIRLGLYEITAKLGEGGMGEVWRARDTKLERDVAIKVLPTAFVEDHERLARFEREAKLLAQLNHPNIAHIYGMEASGEAHALVMELVGGPTLAERLGSGSLPLDESLSLARQIAEALEEAHEKGIIHRDLKPQNIKASIEGSVKVLDFGLAKAMDPAGTASGAQSASQLAASPTLTLGATVQGVILGTAAYMSPEQAKGVAVDKRADIWAFGVVLFEMLTGRRLFEGDSVPDTLARVLQREIDFAALPESTPPAIRRLLRRCLERKPKNRLHDIADARIVIDEVLDGEIGAEAPAATVAPAPSRRLPWTIAAVCAVIAVGAIVALILARGAAPRSSSGAPVRTSVLLPRAAEGLVTSNLALAPDGEAVVYLGAEGAGRPRLYVRELASLEARPLESTEGAAFPFWSPDARQIAFFAEGELRRVPRAGGAVQRICAAKAGRGGAWSRDGTIVFAPEPYGPLWKVRASGGEPSPATKLERDPERQASQRFPTFLPDGRHFLFMQTGGGGADAFFVDSTEEVGAGRRLAEATSSPRFAAPDWLVFDQAGALVAQRLDLDRFEMLGEPKLLVDRPAPAGTSQAPRADLASGGRMLYEPADPRPSRLAWIDRTGRQISKGPLLGGSIHNLKVSHRGDRVVANSRTADGRTALWLVDPGREGADRLTPPSLFPWGAEWEGDDRSIVSWVGPGTPGSGLIGSVSTVAVDGGAVRPLLPASGRWILPTAASADGKVLVFWELISGRGRDIVWLPPDSGAGKETETRSYLSTPANEDSGKMSPDGRWIAYVSDASGRLEAYLDRFPTPAGAQRIAAGSVALDVFFRDDGKELFVLARDGDADALFVSDLRLGERAEVGPPRKLFRLPTDYTSFAAAPSGDRFVIAGPEGERWPSLTLVENWMAQLAPEK